VRETAVIEPTVSVEEEEEPEAANKRLSITISYREMDSKEEEES
jgi:hypothetical protein